MHIIDYTFLNITILIISGLFSGIINAIGGGGSLLALPMLMFTGLPASIANGTNRICIFLEDIASLLGYSKKRRTNIKKSYQILWPILIGCIFGAFSASFVFEGDSGEIIMNILLLALIVLTIISIIRKRTRWSTNLLNSLNHKPNLSDYIILIIIGFYGGFIQAGFTYLVLMVLVARFGCSLIYSDIVKIFVNVLITPIALIVFLLKGQVDIVAGLILGIGSIFGGYIGAKLVTRLSTKITILILMVLLGTSGIYVALFRLTKIGYSFFDF